MPCRIYFDNAATTPLDPRVADAMEPWLRSSFGNPSSLYAEGREARSAVEAARAEVAALIGAAAEEIVFTASGTESDNLALAGALGPGDLCGAHLIVGALEHPAILATARALAARGAEMEILPVGSDGIADPADLASRIRKTTRLVSMMAASNVLGTLQPVAELGRICRERGVLFHVDCVQAAGKTPVDVGEIAVDLASLSAHKLYGPKGVGALFVRRGVRLRPLLFGGGQERGLRPATENVAGIAGFGAAARLAAREAPSDASRLVALRERLLEGLTAALPELQLLGHPTLRLPGHLCLLLQGREGETIRLLLTLDEEGIAVSAGSACSARSDEPASALLAIGLDPVRARGGIRVSLGRFNTLEDVERFLHVFPRVTAGLRPVASRRFHTLALEQRGNS